MADDKHKRYQLTRDIHLVNDAEKDPIGTPHKAGKRFSAEGLRRAGIDTSLRDHWIDKGVIVDLEAPTEEGGADGET